MAGASNHFRQRVLERFPPGIDPDALADEITAAIRTERWDFIERVMRTHRKDQDAPPRSIWRIRLGDVSGYVVVCDLTARPITAPTQEQMRATKAARRTRRPRLDIEKMEVDEESKKHGRARIVRLRKQGGVWR